MIQNSILAAALATILAIIVFALIVGAVMTRH